MATFDYRCTGTTCPATATGPHRFEVTLPIGTAPGRTPCPACGSDAVRVYAAPAVSLAPAHLMAALDRAERSRTEPDVVQAIPGRTGRVAARRASTNPALRRLPRP